MNVQYGSDPEIATDNWYADLDDDRVPELAVGRLPCDSAAELSCLVQRIIDYETSRDFGPWRRQVHFVAGLGGFGAMADAVLEAAAKSLIGDGIPSAYATTMTYGSWQSPYCPDPRQFQQVTIERFNEGSLFWVYMGHGELRAVDPCAHRARRFRFSPRARQNSLPASMRRRSPASCPAMPVVSTGGATAWPKKCCGLPEDQWLCSAERG